ncbi:MAG: SUMF1/EgtB/PvdO family nonheme iron enzyme [Candidatus Merdousia sp.]|nr:SUMF1/EgtB/PvdO family nonheme iron enzyme [Candidatus Merdousia sp.]
MGFKIMSVVKFVSVALLSAAVLGGFYLMAILGPGRAAPDTYEYVDPNIEGEEILKASERYEKEFEAAAAANERSEEAVALLKKSIAYQEQYIDKAKTLNRAPAQRLTALRTRLHDVEAAPLAETVALLEKKAESAAESDYAQAVEFYKQAYDLQSKINAEYPLSKYKNIERRVVFDRQIKMLQAKPLYLETLELERKAGAALEANDLLAAEKFLESAIDAISKLHSEHPSSIYTDFARLLKLESDLQSLRSGGFAQKIADDEKKAAELIAKKDYIAAADAYSDALENQRSINSLYPKSKHASEEKAREFERLKAETYSRKYAGEIEAQSELLKKSLSDGNLDAVSQVSENLIRKIEHFVQAFPQSRLLSDETLMRARYINFISRDIVKIRALIIPNLADAGNGVKMLRTEVSQRLYALVMQENPSRFSDNPDRPVDSATVEEAASFCTRAGWVLGKKISLPDEQTYRSAIGSLRYADIDEISWNYFNSSGTTHPIATKKPNDRGFYDLLGNVAEYLAQPSDADSARVIGGNAQTASDAIKDIPVSDFDPKQRNRMVGFRIVVSDK